jgi:hypothetical protein
MRALPVEAVGRAKKPIDSPPTESEFRYAGPKPRTKEAAIIMLADAVEGAVRSLSDVTLTKVDAVVHNIAMKRLEDGQFDECDLTLRELSQIEASMAKSVAPLSGHRVSPRRTAPPSANRTSSCQDGRDAALTRLLSDQGISENPADSAQLRLVRAVCRHSASRRPSPASASSMTPRYRSDRRSSSPGPPTA